MKGSWFGYVISAFVDGWLLMLAFGLAHSSAHQVPPFGYWVCVFVTFVLGQIAATGPSMVDYRRFGKRPQ